jgi:hypothetical protein
MLPVPPQSWHVRPPPLAARSSSKYEKDPVPAHCGHFAVVVVADFLAVLPLVTPPYSSTVSSSTRMSIQSTTPLADRLKKK